MQDFTITVLDLKEGLAYKALYPFEIAKKPLKNQFPLVKKFRRARPSEKK